jgi:hypothetical protein
MQACTFRRNRVDTVGGVGGGALFLAGQVAVSVDASTFEEHSALVGGAVYADSVVSATLRGCRLSRNSALEAGGAIALRSQRQVTNVAVADCVLERNLVYGVSECAWLCDCAIEAVLSCAARLTWFADLCRLLILCCFAYDAERRGD